MTGIKKENKPQAAKKNLFELLTEIVGWLQIAAAPVLAGFAIGAVIYSLLPTATGLVIAAFICVIVLLQV